MSREHMGRHSHPTITGMEPLKSGHAFRSGPENPPATYPTESPIGGVSFLAERLLLLAASLVNLVSPL